MAMKKGRDSRREKRRKDDDDDEDDDATHYNVVSSPENSTKLTLRLSKSEKKGQCLKCTYCLNLLRKTLCKTKSEYMSCISPISYLIGSKRRRVSSDDDYLPDDVEKAENIKNLSDVYGEYGTSLTERVKRRKRIVAYNEDSDEDDVFAKNKREKEARLKEPTRIPVSQRSEETFQEGRRCMNIIL